MGRGTVVSGPTGRELEGEVGAMLASVAVLDGLSGLAVWVDSLDFDICNVLACRRSLALPSRISAPTLFPIAIAIESCRSFENVAGETKRVSKERRQRRSNNSFAPSPIAPNTSNARPATLAFIAVPICWYFFFFACSAS
jgi:hypothetical protein